MSPTASILLPLGRSPTAAQGVGCAILLAERLGASLHVLSATPDPQPPRQALEQQLLCHGEVAQQILDLIDRRRASLLALSWHGSFATGHAKLVKRLLGTLACPALLVKPLLRAPFVLRVGEARERPTVRGEDH